MAEAVTWLLKGLSEVGDTWIFSSISSAVLIAKTSTPDNKFLSVSPLKPGVFKVNPPVEEVKDFTRNTEDPKVDFKSSTTWTSFNRIFPRF